MLPQLPVITDQRVQNRKLSGASTKDQMPITIMEGDTSNKTGDNKHLHIRVTLPSIDLIDNIITL